MAIQLDKEVTDLIEDQDTVKILATIDEKGSPHAVVKQSFHLEEDGNLVYLELLESSRTNRNLVRSLWFNQGVSVTLSGRDGLSYQIKGRPVKAVICGPVFRKYYEEIRRTLGDTDLATVWIIKPEEVINETYNVRKTEEESQHPFFKHLDRLVKEEERHV